MRTATILLTALSCAATTFAQSVEIGVGPDEASPDGCEQSVDGNFTINIAVPISSKFKRESATEAAGTALGCTLKEGVLTDPYGRIGSIVANYQFQFDGPPQAGAIYTGGFSACKNSSLAIGGSTRWWRCMSGEFGNLYDRSIGDQCTEIRIVTSMLNQPSSSSSSSAASSTASSSEAKSSSTWSVESASVTASVTPVASSNSTVSSGTLSGSGSPTASITDSPSATGADSSATSGSTGGAAIPTRLPRAETFGAVVGILGAALML